MRSEEHKSFKAALLISLDVFLFRENNPLIPPLAPERFAAGLWIKRENNQKRVIFSIKNERKSDPL
jgi:hypothetical protein